MGPFLSQYGVDGRVTPSVVSPSLDMSEHTFGLATYLLYGCP